MKIFWNPLQHGGCGRWSNVLKLHVYQTDNVDALYQRHLSITTPGSKFHVGGPVVCVATVFQLLVCFTSNRRDNAIVCYVTGVWIHPGQSDDDTHDVIHEGFIVANVITDRLPAKRAILILR